MIFILDFVPLYCANCGKNLNLFGHRDAMHDFSQKCSHTCRECGAQYQRANTDHLLEAATKSGGDLKQYYKG